jgi:hypothetical protein
LLNSPTPTSTLSQCVLVCGAARKSDRVLLVVDIVLDLENVGARKESMDVRRGSDEDMAVGLAGALIEVDC